MFFYISCRYLDSNKFKIQFDNDISIPDFSHAYVAK